MKRRCSAVFKISQLASGFLVPSGIKNCKEERSMKGINETETGRLNTGLTITYEELLNYNNYINVYFSASDFSILIAQGDIGSNAN